MLAGVTLPPGLGGDQSRCRRLLHGACIGPAVCKEKDMRLRTVTLPMVGSMLVAAMLAASPQARSQPYAPGMLTGPGGMDGSGTGPGGMGPGRVGGWGPGFDLSGAPLSGLDLDDDQAARVAAIRAEVSKRHDDLAGRMQDEQFRLRRRLAAPQRDEAAIERSVTTIRQLREQIGSTMTDARTRIEAALTPEQRSRLRQEGGTGGR
jgi:Spy/CpxP family protein refolding chaperone